MIRTIVLPIALLIAFMPAQAQSSDPQATLARARTALADANYSEAIEAYESLYGQGRGSAELFLNLGNAYLGQRDIGRAALAYERGLRLRPNNRALNRNRTLLREQQQDAIIPFPRFFLLRWWHGIAGMQRYNAWGWTGLLFFWLAAAAFFLFRYRNRNGWLAIAAPLLVTALLSWAFANTRYQDRYRNDQLVLLAPRIELRVAPGEDAPVEATLHAGLTLRSLDQFGEWTKVELLDGRQGWLHSDEVAAVVPLEKK
jgi:tetratricopeptide (TPR) repeat protein